MAGVPSSQFVEWSDVRFEYCRFGKQGGVPLLVCTYLIGTLDYWNPALSDALAERRDVILFDNDGVTRGGRRLSSSAEEMAVYAALFVRALRIEQIDVLGFSLGGFVAQLLAVAEPELCRRLILLAAGPQSVDTGGTTDPFGYLADIHQPTLVANSGVNFVSETVNAYLLQQHIPNAHLVLYPDRSRNSRYRYPELFARHVSLFLSA